MRWYWVVITILALLAAILLLARYFMAAAAMTISTNLLTSWRRLKKIQDEHDSTMGQIDTAQSQEADIRSHVDAQIAEVKPIPNLSGWDDTDRRSPP